MARSEYVYVVHRGAGPIAAFTVKRELHRAARANGWYAPGFAAGYRVSRMRDGAAAGLLNDQPLTDDY
jgi:hypothetical protein